METEVLETVEGTETICQHPRLTYRRSVLVTDSSDTARLKVSGASCPDCGIEFVMPTATGFAESATLALVSRERAKEMALAKSKSPPAPAAPVPTADPAKGLPGTEMLQLTAELGIVSPPACGCKGAAAQMDRMGLDECRARSADLRIMIASNWANWGWKDKLAAVAAAAWKGAGLGVNPTDPVRDLLEIAFDRAETKMKELAQ